jgi:hypothetical protein
MEQVLPKRPHEKMLMLLPRHVIALIDMRLPSSTLFKTDNVEPMRVYEKMEKQDPKRTVVLTLWLEAIVKKSKIEAAEPQRPNARTDILLPKLT